MIFGQPFGGLIPGARGAVLSVLLRTGAPLTGRQIHGLLKDDFSLWSVQEALKALKGIGLVEGRTVGRADVNAIQESHYAVPHLRALLDPISALTTAIRESIDPRVDAVLLFGSVARGDSTAGSDVDLAVVTAPGWDGRLELEDAVRARLGSDCDVLVFTDDEFRRLAAAAQPVVTDILRDGIALIGSKPRVRMGVA